MKIQLGWTAGAVLCGAVASAQSVATELCHQVGTGADDHMGYATSALDDVDGDGFDDVAVGMPLSDSSGLTNNGRVAVLSGRDGAWIYAIDGVGAGENFGYALDAVGDVDGDSVRDLIVGAPFFSEASSNGGRAVVLSGANGALVANFSGPVGSRMGTAVAGLPDMNGDGIADIAIGAPYANYGGPSSGRVWAFPGGVWTGAGTFDGTPGDLLGSAIDGIDDFDGDGVGDLIIGAPFADPTGASSGRAYVISGASGGVLRSFDGATANDQLGYAVAGLDDWNGDGLSEVAIGAPNDDGYVLDGGELRVFPGAPAGAAPAALHTIQGGQVGMHFAWSLARSGDASGDGIDDLLVGTPFFNGVAADSGYAAVIDNATGLGISLFLGNSGGDSFGWSVAPAGDVNGDGWPDYVIGAHGENGGGDWDGGVWVYTSRVCSVTAYCWPKTNSLGCIPLIDAEGLPLVSGGVDHFAVKASQVRNQRNGMLIWSLSPAALPFAGGTLCVGAPIHRTPIQDSLGSALPADDCTGTYAFEFTQAYMASKSIAGGTTVYCQFWSRDPGFAPPNNVGLTAGLSFTPCP